MRTLAAVSKVTVCVLETKNSMTNFWLMMRRDLSFLLPAATKQKEKKTKKPPQAIVIAVSVVLILESLTLTVSVVSLRALVLAAQASPRGLHPQLHVEVVALLPSSLLQLLQRGLQVLPAIPGVAVLRYSAHDHERLEHVDDVVDTPPLDS